MGIIQSFERRLQGAVGNTFARLFGGTVHPAEVITALQDEANSSLKHEGGRMIAPNHFTRPARPDRPPGYRRRRAAGGHRTLGHHPRVPGGAGLRHLRRHRGRSRGSPVAAHRPVPDQLDRRPRRRGQPPAAARPAGPPSPHRPAAAGRAVPRPAVGPARVPAGDGVRPAARQNPRPEPARVHPQPSPARAALRRPQSGDPRSATSSTARRSTGGHQYGNQHHGLPADE